MPESLNTGRCDEALEGRYPAVASSYSLESRGDSEEKGGLIQYWFILKRNKGTVILVAFVGALVGYLATLPQTPVYQAHTTIEVENLNQDFLNIKQVNPTQNGIGGSEVSDIQTQIRILQSESLLERVVGKLKSAPTPADPGRVSAWRKALNLPDSAPADAYQQGIRAATHGLKVRAAGLTRIIELTVDSTNPRAAAEFANSLTSEYIEQNLESRWKTTEKTTEWLTRQLDGMRVKLERSEDQLQQYARGAGLIFTDEKTNVSSAKLAQLQEALSAAETERIGKQSRFEMANTSPPEALPDILSDLGLRDYQSKLTDLRRQIAELSSTFTADYPKVKRAEAQYAIIEAAFNHERGAILKRIKNEYEEALRREQLLTADYSAQAKLVSGEGERGIQYNILKREVDSNRQLYDTMLQQLKQASIASALRASNVRVVDPAKSPTRPYKPDATQSAGLGGIAGLLLGIAFVVMRDRADRSIQQPGDSMYYLNLPELGIIPSSSLNDSKVRLALNKTGAVGDKSGSESRVELITMQRKTSMAAEAFRSALVSILFGVEKSSRPKVLVLTSAGPGEGKSTVSCNLAIAIAEVGNRVLLIDADMRKPRIHHVFNVPDSPGLSTVLKDRSGPGASALGEGVIRETAIPDLFLLTSGGPTSGSMNLLYGPRMVELLNHVRQQFDTIVIDTPPMLQISDARVLGRLADRVILVIRAGQTTRDAALAALRRFQEDGSKVLGTILNDWNSKNSPDGYYGHYNGYYKGYQDYYRNSE